MHRRKAQRADRMLLFRADSVLNVGEHQHPILRNGGADLVVDQCPAREGVIAEASKAEPHSAGSFGISFDAGSRCYNSIGAERATRREFSPEEQVHGLCAGEARQGRRAERVLGKRKLRAHAICNMVVSFYSRMGMSLKL